MCASVCPTRQFRRPVRPHLNYISSSFSSIMKLIFGMRQSVDIIYSNYYSVRGGKKRKKENRINWQKYLFSCVSSTSRWFCHFDDDNYVNVPQLVQLLNEYHPTKDWYLGKPSVASPLEIHLDLVSEIRSHSITTFNMPDMISVFRIAAGIEEQRE